VLAHDVIAITMLMVTRPGLSDAASTIASGIHGITRNQFVTALRRASLVPPT
jgi:hypothetical protein